MAVFGVEVFVPGSLLRLLGAEFVPGSSLRLLKKRNRGRRIFILPLDVELTNSIVRSLGRLFWEPDKGVSYARRDGHHSVCVDLPHPRGFSLPVFAILLNDA
jgi:hypothetical protein